MACGEDHVDAFRAAMAACGLPTSERLIGDGKLHRFRIDGERKGGGRSGWYVLHLDGRANAVYGCNRRYGGQTFKWSAMGSKRLSHAERKALVAEMKSAQARRLADEKARHDAAAARASAIWNSAASAEPRHPYLVRKAIEPFGIRQGKWHNDYADGDGIIHERVVHGALLVPMLNKAGEIRSLQAIFPSEDNALRRGKDFLPGGEIQGCYFPIGEITSINGVPIIAVCEGFATGASVHKSTSLAVRVAFTAGNLERVAASIRATMPNAMIVIIADDDKWTDGNPGLTKAREAAAAVRGSVAEPKFTSLEGRPTDFNDLNTKEGTEVVKQQIMSVVTNAVEAEVPPVDRANSKSAAMVETAPPDFSEDALAAEFAERHLDNYRYVKEQGCWYVLKDGVWQEDKTGSAFHSARNTARRVAAHPNASSLSNGQVRALASSKTATAVLKMASADPRLAITADRFDCDLWALNTPAGVVDLRTGEIRPVRPTDYMTKVTAVVPDTTCPTPIWDDFLNTVTGGDRDLIAFLKRLLGYCLTGLTREQVLAFLYGTGANGKSVFMNTAFGIMGNYHKPAAMETFTESKFDRHPAELAILQNARVVSAAETEEGRHFAEAKIKVMTGGDPIVARRMRQDFFEYIPQFKLFLAGNHKPVLRAVDESIRRRFLMVPFIVTIPPERRDKDLQMKLKAEWPGILAWMIQGCLEWQRDGLNRPESVKAATQDYMEAEDAISSWVEDCCVRDSSAWTSVRSLYLSWKAWATGAGEHVIAEKRFVEQLAAHGYERHRRSDGRGFIGLTVISSPSNSACNWSDGYDA